STGVHGRARRPGPARRGGAARARGGRRARRALNGGATPTQAPCVATARRDPPRSRISCSKRPWHARIIAPHASSNAPLPARASDQDPDRAPRKLPALVRAGRRPAEAARAEGRRAAGLRRPARERGHPILDAELLVALRHLRRRRAAAAPPRARARARVALGRRRAPPDRRGDRRGRRRRLADLEVPRLPPPALPPVRPRVRRPLDGHGRGDRADRRRVRRDEPARPRALLPSGLAGARALPAGGARLRERPADRGHLLVDDRARVRRGRLPDPASHGGGGRRRGGERRTRAPPLPRRRRGSELAVAPAARARPAPERAAALSHHAARLRSLAV